MNNARSPSDDTSNDVLFRLAAMHFHRFFELPNHRAKGRCSVFRHCCAHLRDPSFVDWLYA